MANVTTSFLDTIYTSVIASHDIVQTQSFSKAFEEDLVLGEEVTVSALTIAEIGIEEGIELEDTLEKTIELIGTKCTPIGFNSYPRLELQARVRIPTGWTSWSTEHAYTFKVQTYRRDRWGVIKIPRGDDLYVIMESKKRRIMPYDVDLGFEIDWQNIACETTYFKLLMDYALDWQAGAWQAEQRRIMFYPAGLGQTDRDGYSLDPIQVFIESASDFWQRHGDFDGRRGTYQGTTYLVPAEIYTYATWKTVIPFSEALP